MIVRDVVLSSESRALRAVPDSQRRPTRDAGAASGAPQPTAKPVLTVEAVGVWLAAQSADVRTAVAQGLAKEIDAVHEQGRAQGIEAGYAEGLREVAQRTDSSLTALARIASVAEETFAHEAAQLAEACADVVAEVFLKIAGDHLTGREAIQGAVMEVLKRVKDEGQVTIRVSAQDLALLHEHDSPIQQALGSRDWTMVADSRVSVGGCLVESSLGTLDGRLEVQIRQLFETIRAAKAARWVDA